MVPMILGFLCIIFFVALIPIVIQLIGKWRTFTKAGQSGWKVLIPYYDTYTEFKFSGVSPWFLLVYLLPIILMPVHISIGFTAGVLDGLGNSNILLVLISTLISILEYIALFALQIYSSYKLAKVFGRGVGFTIGLFLVPWIFYPIIGFSKNIKYIGPNGQNTNKDDFSAEIPAIENEQDNNTNV